MTLATATTRVPQRITPPGGARIRPMLRADLERIVELRKVSYRSSDPRGFGLLHGIRGARWAVAETPKGRLTGMVGAVPLGETGFLCHLAVLPDHRGRGLGTALSSWAVSYLKNWGAETVRLYRPGRGALPLPGLRAGRPPLRLPPRRRKPHPSPRPGGDI